MPYKGTAKKSEKNCLVCGGITSAAHLGIDLCRACAIFYRRAPKRRVRTCRASTNQCPTGEGLNCKKCRFDWIERMLNRAPLPSSSERSQCSPAAEFGESNDRITPPESSWSSKGSLLEGLRTHYRSMCHTRMIAEMHARGDPSHPLSMDVDAPWNIVTEFFYRFRTFEGCFRANVCFPEHPKRFLPNFTSYLSPEVYAHFYDGFPKHADVVGAVRYIKSSPFNINDEIPLARAVIARLHPHHEEILAVMGLMFWSIDALSPRQHLCELAETYRKQIMRELHAFYRQLSGEKLKLDDYASRLGELLMFIQLFDVKERYQEHFENLRLLNILDDDNFIYRLQKE